MAIVPLYGVTIHKCIASGDIKKMQSVAKAAEKQLKQHGDIRAALESLKVEIAKYKKKR